MKTDDVVSIHKQIRETYERLCDLFLKTPEKDMRLWVKCSRKQPEGTLKGYFVIDDVIYRCMSVTFDYLILLSEDEGDVKSRRQGVEYSDIERSIKYFESVIYTFSEGAQGPDGAFNIIAERNANMNISDEIGLAKRTFPGVVVLQPIDLFEAISNKCDIPTEYTLVGMVYYAPHTVENCYCALFAQTDNEYDENAIQILRWFPKKKSECSKSDFSSVTYLDMFFEMGYIKAVENKELHGLMIAEKTRMLFGEKKGNTIHLLGSTEIFLKEDYYVPKCLARFIDSHLKDIQIGLQSCSSEYEDNLMKSK